MARKKIIARATPPLSRSMGPNVRQVIPSGIETIDPFVFLDHFGPVEKKSGSNGVEPHPHAGIVTVTYLFSGSNRHQDSSGNDVIVKKGDLAWMQAGKGIIHSEGMNEVRNEPEIVEGLQFWISLPAKYKFIDPAFFHYRSDELPYLKLGKARVKVLCGELYDSRSPVQYLSPTYIYEVILPANTGIELPLREGDTAGLYVRSGSINTTNEILEPTSIASFSTSGNMIETIASRDAHFLIFGGTPLNEPIFGHSSFVMNSVEQIKHVISDFHAGKMGVLKND